MNDLQKAKAESWFTGWEVALAQQTASVEQRAWTREIVGRFLAECAVRGQEVSVPAAREFVGREVLRWQPQAGELAGWKAGLNWFFREGKRRRQLYSISRRLTPAATGLAICWLNRGFGGGRPVSLAKVFAALRKALVKAADFVLGVRACLKSPASECASPRAQRCEHFRRTRKIPARRGCKVAAPEDGRTPPWLSPRPKRIFRQAVRRGQTETPRATWQALAWSVCGQTKRSVQSA